MTALKAKTMKDTHWNMTSIPLNTEGICNGKEFTENVYRITVIQVSYTFEFSYFEVGILAWKFQYAKWLIRLNGWNTTLWLKVYLGCFVLLFFCLFLFYFLWSRVIGQGCSNGIMAFGLFFNRWIIFFLFRVRFWMSFS